MEKSGKYYGLKWDDGFDAWSSAAPDSNDCIRYFEGSTDETVLASSAVASSFNRSDVTVTVVSDCEWRLSLPLPSGFTYVQGYIKFGNVRDRECPKAATPGPTYVSFSTA